MNAKVEIEHNPAARLARAEQQLSERDRRAIAHERQINSSAKTITGERMGTWRFSQIAPDSRWCGGRAVQVTP